MRIALIVGLGLSAGIAHAEDPRLGITVDAGVPDGANTALVLRPIDMLRVSVGMGYNGITRGYRAGASFVPLHGWFSPSLSVDVGAYPEGDANPLARMATGDQTIDEPTLKHVGYRYANLHAGLEFGHKWATFYIHAGLSHITGRVHDLTATMAGSSSDTSVTLSDPNVTINTISARLGLVVYFH